MRYALLQHLLGLFVTLVVLPVCALAYFLTLPYLYVQSYRASARPNGSKRPGDPPREGGVPGPSGLLTERKVRRGSQDL